MKLRKSGYEFVETNFGVGKRTEKGFLRYNLTVVGDRGTAALLRAEKGGERGYGQGKGRWLRATPAWEFARGTGQEKGPESPAYTLQRGEPEGQWRLEHQACEELPA